MFHPKLGLSWKFAVFALGIAHPLAAQTSDAANLSAAEIEQLFENQRTRGLSLVPAGEDSIGETPQDNFEPLAPPQDNYVAVRTEDQVNVQITFDFDSAALREDQKPKLSTLCQVLLTSEIELFRIIGHTDASGSDAYNERLSLLRAEEVKRFFVQDCGIEDERLQAVGVGEAFLLVPEDPNGDRNRRVEFQASS